MTRQGIWGWTLLVGFALTPGRAGAAQTSPPELQAFMSAVESASNVAAPYERCLRFPDPPGSHWRPEAVKAYCRFANEDTLTSTSFRELIAAGKGAEVDRAFASYLKSQLHDPAHPARFDAAIRRAGIRISNPETRKAIDAWMRQRPRSAFAVASSAIQYHEAALDARGFDVAANTSDSQVENMQVLAQRARKEFDRAATMKPAVPTMYGYMFATGTLLGDEAYATAAITRGLSLLPTSFDMRLTHANMSGAKWGGSAYAVHQQGEEATAMAERTPLLWVVSGRAAISDATGEGFHAPADRDFVGAASEVAPSVDLSNLAALASAAGRKDQALILAAEAIRFDNGNDRALYHIAKLAPLYGYNRWLRATLLAAAKDHPDSIDVARMSGGYLSLYGDVANSEPLLKAVLAARPDDVWSIDQLAQLYAMDAHRPDDALRLVDDLLQRHPDEGYARVIQARLLIAREDPRRYASIRHFLAQFAQNPAFRDEVAEMAAYLNQHPETPAATAPAAAPSGS